MIFVWYFFDDTLAKCLEYPQIGQIDWWVILLLSIGLNLSISKSN